MDLKNIILHQITREGDELPTLNYSDHNLLVDETVIEFVKKLIKNYSSKNPTFGTFEEDITNYPFQTKVKQYIQNLDFVTFSTESMNILKKEIQVPKATGGYIVFVHYEERHEDFIITAMLDKSTQFAVDDTNLGIEKLKTLDIEKVARANRINISKWNRGDSLYLSFIKGTRNVSNYFQKFIGSTDITSAKYNVKLLDNAINMYLRKNNVTGGKKDLIKENISNYFESQYKNKEDITLSSIASIINPEQPSLFSDFLSSQNIELSGNFSLSKRDDFNIFKKSVVKEKGYTFGFEKELIKNGKIERVGNDILIKNVPAEQLDSAFNI
ncbi:hypothetical protein ETU08_09055 [Apibacter muscae]|uniref:nucleoid-associated protein n=1 Tax=Apibacter muscae TaxID=2509004 RepID=UPI0011ACFCDC|nr:nucleoid-associated protein [Apibacter muscae]TWP28580.1 hypothetical protein ETU08_09055 [Apibacter muscae]